MSNRSSSFSVFERSAKFLSRSFDEMFELVASSMDECLSTAKRTSGMGVHSKPKDRKIQLAGKIEPDRQGRPH
jgi:hypothetical protein